MAAGRPLKNFGERTVNALEGLISDPQSLLEAAEERARMSNAPNYALELDILSAATYPNIPQSSPLDRRPNGRKRGAAPAEQQFYGGFTMRDAEHDSVSSNTLEEQQEKPRPKKKRRSTKDKAQEQSDDDEANKKQRGRPRLDTQDETAADRRRTQIRLAQRAYRHRKETTITALKERVGELESTIEQMSKGFQKVHDNLFDSGILASNTALRSQLVNMAERFTRLVQIVASRDEEREEEANNIASMRTGSITSVNFLEQDGGQDDVEMMQKDSPTSAVPWGYEMSYEALNDADQEQQATTSSPELAVLLPTSGNEWQQTFQQFNVQLPEPTEEVTVDFHALQREIERPLKTNGPYTYSFQETTFARRLHRMCLEYGYRKLTSPNADPEHLKKTFKFTFCFSNRKRMLYRFQELLKRKAGESLENWDVPFIRVGGAGTHFPRIDAEGKPVYPPNMITPQQVMGPRVLVHPETPREGEEFETMLENLGFGGEWFDSHDVEEYLKTKGVWLDGTSSFVDVDPSLIVVPGLSTDSRSVSSVTESPRTPEWDLGLDIGVMMGRDGQALHGFAPVQDKVSAYGRVVNTLHGSMWPRQNSNMFTDQSGGFDATFLQQLQQQQQQQPRQLVTVDVNRFLQRMVEEGSTCLGRAPGFRKEQVDVALALSLLEAF